MIQREGFCLPGFHGFTSGPHLLPTAAGTSGSVPPRCPPPSLSLADTPHLARHQLIAAFTGCRLAQCGVTQRHGNQTKTQQDSLMSHVCATDGGGEPSDSSLPNVSGLLVRLRCAESSCESVPSLRVHFIFVPSPTLRHKLPVQLFPQCLSSL